MSWLKIGIAAAGVAVAAYGAYRVAKKHPKATAAVGLAVLNVMANGQAPVSPLYTEKNDLGNSGRIIVRNHVVEVEADEDYEGVMSVAEACDDSDCVTIEIDGDDVIVTTEEYVPAFKDLIDMKDAERMFGHV